MLFLRNSIRFGNSFSRWLRNRHHRFSFSSQKIRRNVSTAVTDEVCAQQDTKVTTLSNGLRVASENLYMPTCTVGLWIDAGTRYENAQNNGVAHFLEHMAFKGTRKRTQTQLELEVETIGAHLNAYTSREQTVYYSKCFSKDLPKAMEILADILLNSTYDSQAIERERHTILREVQEIEYNLQEVTFDFLHEIAFEKSTLGFRILGPPSNIKSIGRRDLISFVKEHYKGPRMVVSAAGGIDHNELVSLADKHFGQLGGSPVITSESLIKEPAEFIGQSFLHKDDDMPQIHGAIAFQGPGWRNADNIALMVANALVGMWDRTHPGGANLLSRLAANCVRNNLCHSFQHFSTCYIDTGLWGIYFVCDKHQGRHFVDAVINEWLRLCWEINDEEIHRAKNILKANLLLQLDGSTPICEDIGRQMLCYGRRIPLHELEARIDLLDANIIKEICSQYVLNKTPAIAALGPVEHFPNHAEISNRLKTY